MYDIILYRGHREIVVASALVVTMLLDGWNINGGVLC